MADSELELVASCSPAQCEWSLFMKEVWFRAVRSAVVAHNA